MAGEVLDLVFALFELPVREDGHWVIGWGDLHGYRKQGDSRTHFGAVATLMYTRHTFLAQLRGVPRRYLQARSVANSPQTHAPWKTVAGTPSYSRILDRLSSCASLK